MDEIIFDYPEPLTESGVASNASSSDYSFTKEPFGVRVFNDSRPDGDSLLMLELKPDANGVFNSGFSQEFYSLKESSAPKERSESIAPGSGNSTEFTYVAPITTTPGSNIRQAVVLIQDNERELAGLLRHTTLGGGRDIFDAPADSKDDTILAGGGDDVIRSYGGNDILFGEAGNDELDGGDGNDYLFGNSGNDRLFGREGNDWLDGGLGDDRLEGGNGVDTYVVDSLGDQIIDMAGTGIETVRASVDWTLQAGLDHLFLTENARTGVGNSFDNFIRGNNLANTLEGGDGNDTIFGDALGPITGNDVDSVTGRITDFRKFVTYEDFFLTAPLSTSGRTPNLATINGYQDLAQLIARPNGQGGNDILKGGNGNDKLFGWAGDDTLYGEAGNDWLFGGYGNDQLFGGDGNDRLDGEQGADRLEGGFGNDIYVIDDIGDLIVDQPSTGIETIESSITFDLKQYSMAPGSQIFEWTGLDHLTLTGFLDIDALGNSLPNILIGNERKNTLNGREGDDTLIVSEGFDTLTGGAGADKFRFNAIPRQPIVSVDGGITDFGRSTITDFTPGQDVIEISSSAFGNPALSQFSFSPTSGNNGNLFFGTQQLATIQSSSPFSVSQSVKLI